MSSAAPESSSAGKRISSRRIRLGAQDGQSLVIVVAAMFVVIAFAAIAIDLAQWYQKHHQAQVAADAAALAAANCMGSGVCGSTSVGTSTAQSYASTNRLASASVIIDTTAHNVTVTTGSSAPVSFAGLFKVSPSVSARAVANWDDGSVPYSFFAGNESCADGTGLFIQGQGGGTSQIPGVHTNGLLSVNNNSGSTAITGSVAYSADGSGPYCAGTSPDNQKNLSYVSSGSAPAGFLAWPQTYTLPTGTSCNHTGAFFTTDATALSANQILSNGGVYCVTSSFSGTACDSTVDGQTGTIYLDAKVTGVELVAPCVSVGVLASGSTAISGTSPYQYPLVFGTGGPLNPVVGHGQGNNASVPNSTVYVGDTSHGGAITLTGAIYAPGQCNGAVYDPTTTCSTAVTGGTVEYSGNNQVTGFAEAENIWVDKNNFGEILGNGPTNPFGGTALTQ